MIIKLQVARLAFDIGNKSEPLNIALRMLLRAYRFAQAARVNPWQFAVEIEELHRMGVSNSDLRCLCMAGWVLHAEEFTKPRDPDRRFNSGSRHSLSSGTCFILSDNALGELTKLTDKAGHPLKASDGVSQTRPAIAHEPFPHGEPHGEQQLPHWDQARKELRLEGLVVKQFRTPALNQERAIAAFEEENWPIRIDDPLPPAPELDSRRRLIDTIKCLNRSQIHALIRFRGDGTGKGILWERR